MATITLTAKTATGNANTSPRARLPRDVAESLLRTCIGSSLTDLGCVSVPTMQVPSGQELFIGAGFHG